MPSTAQIIQLRHSRHTRQPQPGWGRLGIIGALGTSVLLLGMIGISLGYYVFLTKNLPPVTTLIGLIEPPDGSLLQPSRLYDRTQTQVLLTLQYPSAVEEQYLHVRRDGQEDVSLFSQSLVEATVAAFDPGFWNEPGYSLKGIADGSHPTLAQLLTSDLLLDNEPASLKRNIQERLLAMQVMAQYGREKVMEWYLNSAMYGEFVVGADAAARVYLGKSASQLTIAEAALLTAILKSSAINPWGEWQPIRDCQVQLIQEMQMIGVITTTEADVALRENIQLQPQQIIQSSTPEFTSLVLSQLQTQIPLERVYRGGYRIITTLDYSLQSQAQCAVQLELGRINEALPSSHTTRDACNNAQQLPLPPTGKEQQSKAGDAQVMILDPQVGQILAWVGGEGGNPNPADLITHPAGTVLSPMWYLAGFTQGMSPASMLWDLPVAHSQFIAEASLATYHGPVRTRLALVNDYQGATSELVQQVGMDAIQQTVEKFGISLQRSYKPSVDDLYLQPVSLREAVQGYGVLANQGVAVGHILNDPDRLQSTGILQVTTLDGRIVLNWSDAQIQPIVSSQLAYLVTDVLSDASARSANLSQTLDIGRPAAVKVSISPQANNGWTIGYIPQLVVGVWMGTPRTDLTTVLSASLWGDVMKYASRQISITDFADPGGISHVQVCDPSGLLVSERCPSTVEEVFLQGNEPTQVDNLYTDYYIDTDTAHLATIFTPLDHVEKKVFLSLPPEAQDWAKASGLTQPPQIYDEVPTPRTPTTDSYLTQPEMSATIRGVVEVLGNATMDGFSYFRIEVGQGLYPEEWTQIGQDVYQPVREGLLGTWDTVGLNGPYVIELMVLAGDQRFKRADVLVNVDNTPPTVHIQAPSNGALLAVQFNQPVIIQAAAQDDQALLKIEFLIDGELVDTLYGEPYLYIWPAQAGSHTLLVRAYDKAGNEAESASEFLISR
jgi:membrane carboxypeptidase/penicillin-binding protein